MNQTYAILTRINRPVFPTVVVHVKAPDAITAYRLVALRNPDATILGLMPHNQVRSV